ncbi:LUD domain-containing protein [Sulfobacillus harzensis]|uniref:LUD domain-containing protein n=1 Tax=Sulfobacillus harzensis TaxID=2729629 RepID=A0A7Y0L3P3_9FIRM|nr:LUD domain-containing protein [Sulfobacillus harzensis]NMP21309.1 LUD domain-containing protein [Sulfobacillus harzensis]
MYDHSERIARALSQQSVREARRAGTQGIRQRAPEVLKRFPNLQDRVRKTKENALLHLSDLLKETENHLLARGFHVFRAKNGEEAARYILERIPENSLVIKSKSNLAKEIHLPDALAQAGHRIVETDLGDHINQLLGRRSGHVLMPALGVDIPTIQSTFQSRYQEPDLGSEPEELVGAARRHLRSILETANVSISGANAVTAEGEVVLMENEGNIRAVTSLPAQHFVVAGINKIVPSLEDGLAVVQAASVFGVGQDFGNYCTVLAGPGRDFGPEVHVLLVDGGRSDAIQQEPEPFYCINCGSCLNVCPVFAELGEAYGGERIGGIGIMQTFLLDGAERATQDGLDLCLGCQRCIPACPVRIDTPTITNRMKAARPVQPNAKLRRRFLQLVLSQGELRWSRHLFQASAALGISRRWHRRGKMARDFAPVPDAAPPIRPGSVFPARGEERGSVWLFPGCVMDAWYAGIHWDTIRVLTENGFHVRVPESKACCGALHEHAGMPDPVPTLLDQNTTAFPGTDPIILNAAGCGAFLKQHPNPLTPRIRDLSEFLLEVGIRPPVRPSRPKKVSVHLPCHLAYAQGIDTAPQRLLEIAGYQVLDAFEREACCGSAGTYNLEYPDIAWRLAREKAEDLDRPAPDVICTANPGCLMQIRAGVEALDRRTPVEHLATLLATAYREEGSHDGASY